MALETTKTGIELDNSAAYPAGKKPFTVLFFTLDQPNPSLVIVQPRSYLDRAASDIDNNFANPEPEVRFKESTLNIRDQYNIDVSSFPADNNGTTIVDKAMLYINEQVKDVIESDNPGATVEIKDINTTP